MQRTHLCAGCETIIKPTRVASQVWSLSKKRKARARITDCKKERGKEREIPGGSWVLLSPQDRA